MGAMRILLTNDDGIDSIGLHVLARAMRAHGDVVVIAPDQEYSGAGAALGALHLIQPSVCRHQLDGIDEAWSVSGPPALCVMFARLGAFGPKFDLIVSDIAPNITGIASADQASSIYFLELALDTVRETLKSGATFVAKMFQGAGSDDWIKDLRGSFQKVSIRKPAASRPESREVYVVAKGFKG